MVGGIFNRLPLRDQYWGCESGECHHDLARGVLAGDLLKEETIAEENARLKEIGGFFIKIDGADND